jgi:two-component system, chemotaxis family, response regulator PixG
MSNPNRPYPESTETLFSDLMRIEKRQRTGQLQIRAQQNSQESWTIYFYLGKIVWVSGGKHPVRRWYRAIKRSEPALFQAQNFIKALNEYQQGAFIAQAIENNTLLLNKAKMLIQECWQEVFFNLIHLESLQATWSPLAIVPQQSVWLYVDTTVKRTLELAKEWQKEVAPYRDLLPNHFSPDLAPVITNTVHLQQHVSITAYQVLSERLNGRNTFWDIAMLMQQPLISVVSLLLPLLQNNIIQLREIPDLIPATRAMQQKSTSAKVATENSNISISNTRRQ